MFCVSQLFYGDITINFSAVCHCKIYCFIVYFDSAKRWAINIRRDDLIGRTPEYLNKNCFVCSDHFEMQMFLNDLKNRLQPSAVPTLVDVSNPPSKVFPARKKRSFHSVDECPPPANKRVKLTAKSTITNSKLMFSSLTDCRFEIISHCYPHPRSMALQHAIIGIMDICIASFHMSQS